RFQPQPRADEFPSVRHRIPERRKQHAAPLDRQARQRHLHRVESWMEASFPQPRRSLTGARHRAARREAALDLPQVMIRLAWASTVRIMPMGEGASAVCGLDASEAEPQRKLQAPGRSRSDGLPVEWRTQVSNKT